MAQGLESAILKLSAALRAVAWGDHELPVDLVREARDACDEWLAHIEEGPGSSSPEPTKHCPAPMRPSAKPSDERPSGASKAAGTKQRQRKLPEA